MGRAAQMNAGAAAASGEVLLFLHADVRLEVGSLDQIRRAMEDGTIVGGNFDIRYEGDDWAASILHTNQPLASKLGDTLWRFGHLLPPIRL